MSADLGPFLELVGKSKVSLRKYALVPIVPIVGAFFIPFPDELPFTLLRYGFIGLCVAIAAMLVWASLTPPDAHPVIRALRAPETVGWIFIKVIRNAGREEEPGAPMLQIGLTNGTRLTFPVQSGREEELLAIAVSAAPNAARGWSPELELSYLRDPTSLVRPA